MLDADKLKRQVINGIKDILVPAIKEMELKRHPNSSDAADKMADEISKMFDEIVTEALATVIANSIDYYVKNISIKGQIITTGSPVTQQAKIDSNFMPSLNGVIPNTLGIY